MSGKRGIPIVITGPSGVGKGTVVSRFCAMHGNVVLTKSGTTRKRRVPADPRDDKYIFYTKAEFEKMLTAGKIIEYTIFNNEYYGTISNQIDDILDAGRDVLLEIDIKGAMQVKKLYPEALLILLMPESYPMLEARLRSRKTETEEQIKARLDDAWTTVGFFHCFDYIVVNHTGNSPDEIEKRVNEAACQMLAAVNASMLRSENNTDILAVFYNSAKNN